MPMVEKARRAPSLTTSFREKSAAHRVTDEDTFRYDRDFRKIGLHYRGYVPQYMRVALEATSGKSPHHHAQRIQTFLFYINTQLL